MVAINCHSVFGVVPVCLAREISQGFLEVCTSLQERGAKVLIDMWA